MIDQLIDLPPEKLPPEPSHAVLTVVEEPELEAVVVAQCESFAREGLAARGVIVPATNHYCDLNEIARDCNLLIEQWRRASRFETIMALIMCPTASPLRCIGLLLDVEGGMILGHGSVGELTDGCPDNEESSIIEMPLFTTLFDENGQMFEQLITPTNEPSDLARGRLFRCYQERGRPFAVGLGRDKEFEVLSAGDLPGIEGWQFRE